MRNTIDDVGIVSCELPQDFHTLRAATKESDHHQDFLQPRTFLPVFHPRPPPQLKEYFNSIIFHHKLRENFTFFYLGSFLLDVLDEKGNFHCASDLHSKGLIFEIPF